MLVGDFSIVLSLFNMSKLTLLTSLLAIIVACTDNRNGLDDDNKSGSEEVLGNLYGADTLTIKAQFSDCGEWGGHSERIDIYRDDISLVALYRRDTVNCPNPALFNRRLIETSTLPLSDEDQKDVIHFLKAILESSFREPGISHAGSYYSVSKSGGELKINYHHMYGEWDGFEELKKSITTVKGSDN